MRIAELERRTKDGLGLRVIIETIDVPSHSFLVDRRSAFERELHGVALHALDRAVTVLDDTNLAPV